MEQELQKYMVEFDLPPSFDGEIAEIIDQQKQTLSEYFYEGKVFSSTISRDLSRMWMVMIADSESELIRIIDSLPISRYCVYNYKELMVHNAVQYIPSHSLN